MTEEYTFSRTFTLDRHGHEKPGYLRYIIEQKDERGQTTLRRVFDFSAARMWIVAYEKGERGPAAGENFRDCAEKEKIRIIHQAFAAKHRIWGLPGKIAPLKMD